MTARRLGKRDIFAWLVLLGLSGVLFWETLVRLYSRWSNDPTYSHGFIVPLMTLFFLYDRKERFLKVGVGGSLWGAAALVGALAVFFVGQLGNMFFLQAVSFVGVLASLALLVGGWGLLKLAAFPVAFLLFMCPLPSSVYDPVSAQLRLLASNVSTVLLQLANVKVFREGNILYLASQTLSVEDACSGIRSLFGITATATAFAFLMPGGAFRKAFIIASAVPIAVFSNILRVTGTGLLYAYGSGDFATGFYHALEGWVFYVVALAALFGEFFLIKAIFPTPHEAPGGKTQGEKAEEHSDGSGEERP